jgi:hypothetical protein
VSGDESVVATFSITAAAVQPLVTQVCATLGVSSVQAIFEQFSSEEVRAGLSGSIASLSSLAVVGWESNERCVSEKKNKSGITLDDFAVIDLCRSFLL